jgi:hypothetical protein
MVDTLFLDGSGRRLILSERRAYGAATRTTGTRATPDLQVFGACRGIQYTGICYALEHMHTQCFLFLKEEKNRTKPDTSYSFFEIFTYV